jgi:hypothetical protein
MRIRARSFECGENLRILEGIVTDTRLVLDYEDERGRGHLEARSSDGLRYAGTYGYPTPEPWRHVEFRLYRSGESHLAFVGRWHEDEGDGGEWLILAEAETASPTR